METRKYHNIRLLKAWKDYTRFLKDHIMLEFLFIGTTTIASICVVRIYYEILNALLYEFAFLAIVFIVLFLWKSLRVAPIHIYKEQQDIINSKQKKIEFLEEQQEPKLQIVFDENENGFICDEPGDYGQEIGVQISERIIRIRVDNLSKSNAIEGVEVILRDIDRCDPKDKGKLPVRLELKNKTSSYPDSFVMPIDGKEFFNVIKAFFVVDKRKTCQFVVCHIEQKNNYTAIPLQFDAEKTNYKIRIEVKSNTTLCEPRDFMIGLVDNIIKMWPVD